MELMPHDVCRVQADSFLSETKMQVLMLLYQPMISAEATSLYLTLYAHRFMKTSGFSHDHLLKLLNIPIQNLEKARVKLEEYRLLDTYIKEEEKRNTYLYVLHAPIPKEEFVKANLFMRDFYKATTPTHAKNVLTCLTQSEVSLQGYKNITVPLTYKEEDEVFEEAMAFHTVRPSFQFVNEDVLIDFDYDDFLANTSKLVLPVSARSQENLKAIGKLATVHGISSKKMRVLIKDCVSLKDESLDIEKLKLKCAKAIPDVDQAKDRYSLPPKSFLQAKQNGMQVSLNEAMLLERVQEKSKFPVEVINIMIEYILNISENRLVPKFVDMVLAEWVRDGVKTKEDALNAVAKAKKKSSYKKQEVLPKYYTEIQKNGGMEEVLNQSKISEEEEEKLRLEIEELQRSL